MNGGPCKVSGDVRTSLCYRMPVCERLLVSAVEVTITIITTTIITNVTIIITIITNSNIITTIIISLTIIIINRCKRGSEPECRFDFVSCCLRAVFRSSWNSILQTAADEYMMTGCMYTCGDQESVMFIRRHCWLVYLTFDRWRTTHHTIRSPVSFEYKCRRIQDSNGETLWTS